MQLNSTQVLQWTFRLFICDQVEIAGIINIPEMSKIFWNVLYLASKNKITRK